jgi:hypothetical protein
MFYKVVSFSLSLKYNTYAKYKKLYRGKAEICSSELTINDLVECMWPYLASFEIKLDTKDYELKSVYYYDSNSSFGYDCKNYKKLNDSELAKLAKDYMTHNNIESIDELKKLITNLYIPQFY